MKHLILASLLAGYFTVPAWAGEVTISKLQVKKNLTAGKPYKVTLPYKVTGSVQFQKACFLWSGEGPYCFDAKFGKRSLSINLRTGNPNTYTLTGFIQYKTGGKQVPSNRVSQTIIVK